MENDKVLEDPSAIEDHILSFYKTFILTLVIVVMMSIIG